MPIDTSFACKLCEYTSSRQYNVERHLKVVHRVTNLSGINAAILPFSVSEPPADDRQVVNTVHEISCFVRQSDENVRQVSQSDFSCKKCGKILARKANLQYHEERCTGVPKNECPLCHKSFTCRSSKSRHYGKCKLTWKPPIYNFEEENVEYIDSDFIVRTFLRGKFGLEPLLDKIFFNEEHPENHNVMLKSIKQNIAEVYRDGEWVPTQFDGTIDKMINSCVLLVRTHPEVLNGAPNDDEDFIKQMNEIANIDSETKKNLRAKIKGRLMLRRYLEEQKQKQLVQ
jgi:Zinc finger, C2H2 type